jgi:NADPH:quinone reductase-like Zn-dependent oxidoreductase
MKALIVSDFKQPPRWSDFAEPSADAGERLIRVTAAGLSNLARIQASGVHYASPKEVPFVAGIDGVGRLDDGSRVYFFAGRRPFGAFAERCVAPADLCVPVPDDLDDVTAAALANPAMSSWAALVQRAGLRAGETVLINGATGASGRLAVMIARHLGAGRVIVTGRDGASLAALVGLGADEAISLTQASDALAASFERIIERDRVTVVLDYVWGASASLILGAVERLGRRHAAGQDPIRFVQIGSISGQTITLPAAVLRSTTLELMGSGLGSVPDRVLVADIGEALKVATKLGLTVDVSPVPMADGEEAWTRGGSGRERVVFTLS